MVDTAVPSAVFIAIVLSLIPHDLQYGPQAALIATWLFATYHSGYAISIYIAILAAISFISAAMMPDYTGKDISADAYSED